MYEIDLSTLMLMGLDDATTKVITLDDEFVINIDSKKIIDNSCKYFGSSLNDRVNMTKRLINIKSKSPIIIEESRNIIFFPTASCVNKNSIWISYNNLLKYSKVDDFSTVLYFKKNFNYKVLVKYKLVDNQVVRCMKLSMFLGKRKEFINSDNITLE